MSHYGNIVAVKSIIKIKSGNGMWFNQLDCPRFCSSLSCDNKKDKLVYMKLFKKWWQKGTLCHCASHNSLQTNTAQRFHCTTNFIFQHQKCLNNSVYFRR